MAKMEKEKILYTHINTWINRQRGNWLRAYPVTSGRETDERKSAVRRGELIPSQLYRSDSKKTGTLLKI